jgi:hypothetical protein
VKTFIELEDKEVLRKQKELLVNTVIEVLKKTTKYIRIRAVRQVLLPLPSEIYIVGGALWLWLGCRFLAGARGYVSFEKVKIASKLPVIYINI